MKVEIGLLNSFQKLKIVFSISREGEIASKLVPAGQINWACALAQRGHNVDFHTKEKRAVPFSDI